MRKSTLAGMLTVSALFLAGQGPAATAGLAFAAVPDLQTSTAVRTYAGVEVVSVFSLPDGGGRALTAAYLPGGGAADATVTLTLRDGLGVPIAGFPYQDMWLESADGGLRPCSGNATANQDTDANGVTFWTNPLFAGGHSTALCLVVVNGDPLTSNSGLQISFNSADINGDLAVDLADVALFMQDMFGAYNYRSDFNFDGSVNISDIVFISDRSGTYCPAQGPAARLPESARARMGIFFDESAASTCQVAVAPLSTVTAYLCLVDPVDDTGLIAWECSLDVAGDATLTSVDLHGGLNLESRDGDFAVALGAPLPSSDVIVLADLEILFAGPGPAGLFLSPAASPSSTPPLPAYVNGAGDVLPVWPMSGNFATPAAVINGSCPVPGIAILPDSLEFVVAPDSTTSRILRLADTGTIDEDIPELVWQVPGPLPAWLAVAPADGAVVATGDTSSLVVTVDAAGLVEGQHFWHTLLIESNAGFAPVVAANVHLHVASGDSDAPDPILPAAFIFYPTFPNPFNPQTTIRFDLPRVSRVRLGIYDVAGRLVRTLVDDEVTSGGRCEVVWQGRDGAGRRVAAGTYLCRLEACGFCATRRMTLLQ